MAKLNYNCYFVFLDNKVQGPFTQDDLSNMLDNGVVDFTTKCRHASQRIWETIADYHLADGPRHDNQTNLTALPLIDDDVSDDNSYSADQADDAMQPCSEDANDDSPEVVCPHCWHTFRMSGIKYISRHIELVGDPVLGPAAPTRFIPTSFNPQGYGIDAHGMVCQEMACPRCHLKIPEAIIDSSADIISIVGAPSSGKSYYLTALTWQLRKVLPELFDYSLYDTDASLNMILNQYEALLFRNSNNKELVSLPKTELQGNDFSNQIVLSGMNINLPLPFCFSLQSLDNGGNQQENSSRSLPNLVLYDNAGEHFEPGRDQITNMATMHLMHSKCILFFFDPMKESRAQELCSKNDPQADFLRRDVNQTQLFNEMINRIRKYTGLKNNERYPQTLIFIVSKFDAWSESFPVELAQTQYTYFSRKSMKNYLDLSIIKLVSYAAREWLLTVAPELAASAEAFFSNVFYIPVSALGRIPEFDSSRNMLGIRPDHLKPVWVEVPMLLHFWNSGLISGACTDLDKNCQESTDYQMSGGNMVMINPHSGKRKIIPQLYWGAQVFDQESAKIVRLPKPEASALANAAETEKKSGNDSFWFK